MSNPEQILSAITIVMAGEVFNLYVTDRRVVGISQGSYSNARKNTAAIIGGAVGGVIGGGVSLIIGEIIDTRKRKQKASEALKTNESEGLTLDKLLEMDEKNNFEILYSEINWVKVMNSWVGNSLAVETKTDKGAFQINKEQAKYLADLLPSIDALNGKIK
jgi:hypothetical protein